MNKQEALTKKAGLEKELARLNEIINAPEMSKEDRFWGLINGLQLKVDFKKYPNRAFLFNGEDCWVEYDLEKRYLWLLYSKIWSVFEDEYGLDYEQVQAFIKSLVEDHFKMKGVTPKPGRKPKPKPVEDHFKMKGVTPHWLLNN